MYIRKATIQNIRSVESFEIRFDSPPGWHVLIGDNGSGKSTIIRSIALSLVGQVQAEALRQNWLEWISKKSPETPGRIRLELLTDRHIDYFTDEDVQRQKRGDEITIETTLDASRKRPTISDLYHVGGKNPISGTDIEGWEGFFSAAYGPYRRFKGGSSDWSSLSRSEGYEDLIAHLSVFDESVALDESLNWLHDLNYRNLDKGTDDDSRILRNLKRLVNSPNFLPHGARLHDISSAGIEFRDGNGLAIRVEEMSDGYRSILSMTFELLRQLVRVYGAKDVFRYIEQGQNFINLPGVVCIDEIDAHLHPTWQTRIGQWFLEYFPKIQFIVTTHSPLVCRAASSGSIWRLAAPGSGAVSGEVTGVDKDRLLFGNLLDAYGTEVFGEDVSISKESVRKQEELVSLAKEKSGRELTAEEEKELQELRRIFTTDAPIEL